MRDWLETIPGLLLLLFFVLWVWFEIFGNHESPQGVRPYYDDQHLMDERDYGPSRCRYRGMDC
jgi:choline-glycine betaine transporter